jgi:hypothetical protein
VEQPERTNPADLDQLRRELSAALEHATPIRAKTILQTMIENIRVDARDNIEPTFRIPAVRQPHGSMGETARRANHVLMVATAVSVA